MDCTYVYLMKYLNNVAIWFDTKSEKNYQCYANECLHTPPIEYFHHTHTYKVFLCSTTYCVTYRGRYSSARRVQIVFNETLFTYKPLLKALIGFLKKFPDTRPNSRWVNNKFLTDVEGERFGFASRDGIFAIKRFFFCFVFGKATIMMNICVNSFTFCKKVTRYITNTILDQCNSFPSFLSYPRNEAHKVWHKALHVV